MGERIKISGRKFSLIIRCFSSDITAFACAKIIRVNRNTADRYYNYFRGLVLKDQDEERRRLGTKRMSSAAETAGTSTE